jgi:hypothetical protein
VCGGDGPFGPHNSRTCIGCVRERKRQQHKAGKIAEASAQPRIEPRGWDLGDGLLGELRSARTALNNISSDLSIALGICMVRVENYLTGVFGPREGRRPRS